MLRFRSRISAKEDRVPSMVVGGGASVGVRFDGVDAKKKIKNKNEKLGAKPFVRN